MQGAAQILRAWQCERLKLALPPDLREGPPAVTVVAYFFRPREQAGEHFRFMKAAILETWRHCGFLQTVIVCHERLRAVEDFASEHAPRVRVQIEPTLVPGDVNSMSRDCNARLADRFGTPYALIVQDDGFPLRPGLEEFLGKWDFIGAPYVRDRALPRLLGRLTGCWVSNGGFSLRSHGMCAAAAEAWKANCENRPWRPWMSEDLFYTRALPLRSASYRRSFAIADHRAARLFAVDDIVPAPADAAPFGFHRAETFARLLREGAVR